MRSVEAALAILALVFLSGCAQTAIPSACQSVPAAKMANCVYINSVQEQNPYYCYSLLNLTERKTCLQDSTDTAMRDALQRAPQEQRDTIFVPQQAQPQPPVQNAPSVVPPSAPPVPSGGCNFANSSQEDKCLRALALSQLNVAACDSIADSVQRSGCISDVARLAKNVAACASLNGTEEKSICSYYAKGD